ncbi:MAG: biopolymer transporter ExbD [Myxococcales bacterium]|nr:biopolymer transporter ExbD [Myxococcales bacterium]
MGMNVGGGGGVKNDINVTPLIDVVLVLLIIFLVTMPIMMRTITLEVPRKIQDNEDPIVASRQITILVKADLSVSLNNGEKDIEVPVTEIAKTLRPMLEDKKTDKLVFVDFEDPVPWANTVEIMDMIRSVAADPDHNEIKVALKMKVDPPPQP